MPELLALELAYRRRGGERPSPAEYRRRFPQHAAVIRAVWQQLAAPGATMAPGTVVGGKAATLTVTPAPTMDGAAEPLPVASEPEPAEAELREVQTVLPEPSVPSAAPRYSSIPGYEILEKLGEGAMGVVYKARQAELSRVVALKMIRPERAGEEGVARFRVEAEAVARLQHPHIVQIFEIGEHDGQPFFSLEFVEGGSLESQLKGAPWPADRAAQLVELLARAVQAAHECGIVHRDLKPANVLVSREGVPKVTDFGLAKRLDVETGQTQTGMIMGTPGYMAPEQAAGKKAVGPAADVYALGAVLYELLTGRPPFRAATVLETLEQVRSQEPVPPRRLQRRTPRDAETICLKCLRKGPHERYGSAAELADDLQAFLEHRPIRARPAGRGERAFKWARRHPAQAVACALVALVLGLGGVGGTMARLWREAESAYQQAEQALQQAEVARQQADGALEREKVANQDADRARQQTRQLSYLRSVELAYREWKDGNGARSAQLLADCPAQLRCWEWRYVHRLCHAEPFTLRVNTRDLRSLAFSADAQRLAGAFEDKTVRVWDLATGQEAFTLTGHTDAVNGVAFSPDGRSLASASTDKTVRVWDLATGQGAVTLKGHTGAVNGVAFSPDGQRLASASSDGTVKVWDVARGAEIRTLNGPGSVSCVAFNPDGRRLATAGNLVKLWDTSFGREILSLKGYRLWVYCVAFSPDGKRLAGASEDRTVRVWDAGTGEEMYSLTGHTDGVIFVAFSSDGQRLASASRDGTMKLWDAFGLPVFSLKESVGFAPGGVLAISPDGKRLARACWIKAEKVRGAVTVWDTDTGLEARSLTGHTGTVTSVAFSPDGKRLASASEDKTVKVWDADTGREALSLGHKNFVVQTVAFSPDGRRLASGSGYGRRSQDGWLKVWDMDTGREALSFWDRAANVGSIAFSADGKRLASSAAGAGVNVWDVDTGAEGLLEGLSLNGPSGRVAFSPDGKRSASAEEDGTVRVYDLGTGKLNVTLRGHSGAVSSVAFSPDGKRLASGSGDKTVRVWDLETGQEVLSLNGHTGNVTSVAFSLDGRRLASASEDKTVKVWDADIGQEAVPVEPGS